mmetsp:Transcript_9747/g.13458  ORF Transcript_9747/g.13458 Transcript_9747/m.13458 type:complete len:567 (+) Transcript_9747:50-1750(+)
MAAVPSTVRKAAYDVVVCGAGFAGVSVARHLSEHHRLKVALVDPNAPLSLTSAVSTECYRDVWGNGAMQQLMRRSIDGMETLARESGNEFNMNRNGYLFVATDPGDPLPEAPAEWKLRRTRGRTRHCSGDDANGLHASSSSSSSSSSSPCSSQPYVPNVAVPTPDPHCEFLANPDGMDLLTGEDVHRQFPFLARQSTHHRRNEEGKEGSDGITAAVHARRCGWLDSQGYGSYLLNRAKDHGVETWQGYSVSGIDVGNGRVKAVKLQHASSREVEVIEAPAFVNAAGPFARSIHALLPRDVEDPLGDLNLTNTLHAKVMLRDVHGVIPSHSPMIISADPIKIPWDEGELQGLLEANNEELEAMLGPAWCRSHLEALPAGAHVRPTSNGDWLVFVWEHAHHHVTAGTLVDDDHQDLKSPLHRDFYPDLVESRLDDLYPEMALRAMATIVPALEHYVGGGSGNQPPHIGTNMDGGYYTSTSDSKPVIGPLAEVGGYYFLCGFAGYGLMAAEGAGELCAQHVARDCSSNKSSIASFPEWGQAFSSELSQRLDYEKRFGTASTSGRIGGSL